jgi:hypothetical protein
LVSVLNTVSWTTKLKGNQNSISYALPISSIYISTSSTIIPVLRYN